MARNGKDKLDGKDKKKEILREVGEERIWYKT
jgi:hypothetical protein